MIYVYILQNNKTPKRHYTGITTDIESRIKEHNAGDVPHTAKYKPWTIQNFFAFNDTDRAYAFEKYLKSGSGRAFAKRHF